MLKSLWLTAIFLHLPVRVRALQAGLPAGRSRRGSGCHWHPFTTASPLRYPDTAPLNSFFPQGASPPGNPSGEAGGRINSPTNPNFHISPILYPLFPPMSRGYAHETPRMAGYNPRFQNSSQQFCEIPLIYFLQYDIIYKLRNVRFFGVLPRDPKEMR